MTGSKSTDSLSVRTLIPYEDLRSYVILRFANKIPVEKRPISTNGELINGRFNHRLYWSGAT